MFSSHGSFYYNSDSYNNALIFDTSNGSILKLFDERISINQYYIEKINSKSYVLFAATDKDTKKDGVLNEDDLKTLFIFSNESKLFHEIINDNADFQEFYIVPNNDQIIIKYGLDKNQNGMYEWHEPTILKKYIIRNNKLESLVNDELYNELQDILDGKKQPN